MKQHLGRQAWPQEAPASVSQSVNSIQKTASPLPVPQELLLDHSHQTDLGEAGISSWTSVDRGVDTLGVVRPFRIRGLGSPFRTKWTEKKEGHDSSKENVKEEEGTPGR